VHEGFNFRFGHRAAGDVNMLAEFGREMGFDVKVYPEMKLRGETVSSSQIRRLIGEGRVSRARHLLARPFCILGNPGRGRGYGSKYTVPTINMARYEELVPNDGVYITWTRVGSERAPHAPQRALRNTEDASSHPSETFVGGCSVKPSVVSSRIPSAACRRRDRIFIFGCRRVDLDQSERSRLRLHGLTRRHQYRRT
jgi:riboflavin kinase/FMN adenylyltransferase